VRALFAPRADQAATPHSPSVSSLAQPHHHNSAKNKEEMQARPLSPNRSPERYLNNIPSIQNFSAIPRRPSTSPLCINSPSRPRIDCANDHPSRSSRKTRPPVFLRKCSPHRSIVRQEVDSSPISVALISRRDVISPGRLAFPSLYDSSVQVHIVPIHRGALASAWFQVSRQKSRAPETCHL
jgi:hypothetical protein